MKQVLAKAAGQTLRGIRGQARGADVKHFLGKTHRLAADLGEEVQGELRVARLCKRQVVGVLLLGSLSTFREMYSYLQTDASSLPTRA